jgi:hypothetical protein
MEKKYYKCKLEHNIRCDMNGKCLLCIKKENMLAERWIKALNNDPIENPEQEYVVETYRYQEA